MAPGAIRATRALRGCASPLLAPDPAVALGHVGLAADVAVLAAHHDVDHVLVADVAHLAVRGRVDPHEAPGADDELAAVAELELEPAAVHEVRLLLHVVIVEPGLDPGGQGENRAFGVSIPPGGAGGVGAAAP